MVFGIDKLILKSLSWGVIILTTLALTLLYGDIRFFERPREDWQRASETVKVQVSSEPAACYLVAPSNAADLIEFFNAGLYVHRCPTTAIEELRNFRSVIVITSPYNDLSNEATLFAKLRRSGFVAVLPLISSKPDVQVWYFAKAGAA